MCTYACVHAIIHVCAYFCECCMYGKCTSVLGMVYMHNVSRLSQSLHYFSLLIRNILYLSKGGNIGKSRIT